MPVLFRLLLPRRVGGAGRQPSLGIAQHGADDDAGAKDAADAGALARREWLGGVNDLGQADVLALVSGQ